MLQRAASNAYSWWWASNMRTRQSKWLDNNLQEMEEKVKSMINLIEEDADTFAQKAAMYYQRRPVLINFVEEAYRAYKALADRYDHISGELHKANHTIATAFPDQVQLPMQDDDDEGSPKAAVIDSSKLVKSSAVIQTIGALDKYSENQSFIKKPRPRFAASPIDKDKAQEEIDRLQKEILVLQTEKEFIKSTYESGLAKYLEIEKQITEMQEDVSYLQDEFSASVVIEDDDARALMAATALKSCEETLVSLQEQQKKSTEEARIESDRIREAKQKLKALKKDYGQPQIDTGESDKSEVSSTIMEEEVCSLKQERLGLQSVCERVKEHLQMSSDTSVVELAEKIDELVDKVISLEFTVSSQNAQITRLKSQTDELQNHLQVLEEDKAALIDDSNILSDQLKQAEEELHRAQDLEKSVRDEKVMLQTHFTEAYHSLNDLSEKLHTPRHQDQINATISLQDKENESIQSTADKLVSSKQSHVDSEADSQLPVDSENVQLPKEECGLRELYSQREFKEPEDYSELDGKEKILLEDYTSMLQNYKETKKKLSELEKKSQDSIFEMIVQMRDLKRANARMDEELQALRQKLGSPQTTPSENADSSSAEGPHPRHLKSKSLYSFLTEDRYRESKKLDATFFTDTSSHRIDDIKLSNIEEPQTSSVIEAKFRRDIDMLLEENLDFWLRFCTSYHQIQKFKTTFEELEAEIEKLKDGKKQDGGGTAAVEQAAKQGSEPTEKKLRELNTELQVWLEQNTSLKVELKSRSTSLSNIQEEIARVLKECEAHGVEFPPYQAAKIQGEVINMQQENHKVAIELQAGLDNARELQVEVGRALSKLHDSFELSASNSHHQNQHSRHLLTTNRVPLRTFLFGNKPKKSSIFSCMNPAVRKHYNSMRQHGVPQ